MQLEIMIEYKVESMTNARDGDLLWNYGEILMKITSRERDECEMMMVNGGYNDA